MNRKLRVTEDGDGFSIIDQADGQAVDWIARPVTHATPPGPEFSYVLIAERPENWSENTRWMVTKGTRVRQTSGLNEGRVGTITGQGRSRRANRLFARSLAQAANVGRDLDDDDFEMLIDNEGPVVRWDDDGSTDWLPGQACNLAPLDESRCPCGPLS